MITRTEFIRYLRNLDACDEALEWIEQTPDEPEDLWTACKRGDWMLWLLAAIGYDEQTMRHIACDCAAGTLHFYEQAHPNDPRPRNCIAVARRYADKKAMNDELIAAQDAALDAARGSVYIQAKAAAYAAAFTAFYAASSAANYAASWAAINDADIADIIRTRVAWTDVEREIEFIVYGGM